MGAPISIRIAWAKSSNRFSVTSFNRYNKAKRSSLVVCEKLSNAFLAEATAILTSITFPRVIVPTCSSVAGFKTGKVVVEFGVTQRPSI